MTGPTILMCPPDYYGIEYEINPWMSRSRASDSARAREQWRALHDLLVSLGVDVRLMTPVQGLPDLVFTANAGLVWHETVYLSRFRHAARQGETPVDEEWFAANGFRTVKLPDELRPAVGPTVGRPCHNRRVPVTE
jgi:N-dimethylarginine dimethylaminohydrolase